jgi:hypothetical protein
VRLVVSVYILPYWDMLHALKPVQTMQTNQQYTGNANANHMSCKAKKKLAIIYLCVTGVNGM